MRIKTNENFGQVSRNYLFSEVKERVKAFAAVGNADALLQMGVGDVTRPLPECVVEAARRAASEMGDESTFRGYPPERGFEFLREKISARYLRRGVNVSPDEIFVSDGAKSDAGNISDILGDTPAAIVSPVYPVYSDSCLMAGRRIRLILATRENDFLPTPETVRTPENTPFIIYLCSPNNPTGATFSFAGLKKWVDFALDSGSLIVFDAAYEAFITEDKPHSIYEIDGASECAVEICSFSKMAGFTGMRAAWSVFPKTLTSNGVNLNKLWARRQSTKFNGVSYIVQRAAEAALTDAGEKACGENIRYYLENADLIVSLLKRKDIFYSGGVNSPFVWFSCPRGMDSWATFDFFLREAHVVGTPGLGFGSEGEGYFRLTAFSSRETTLEAVRRLDKIL